MQHRWELAGVIPAQALARAKRGGGRTSKLQGQWLGRFGRRVSPRRQKVSSERRGSPERQTQTRIAHPHTGLGSGMTQANVLTVVGSAACSSPHTVCRAISRTCRPLGLLQTVARPA